MAEPPASSEFEVVSSENEELILVDQSDRVIGHLPKGACHDGIGVLHRAFSIFIFNRAGELLLQRRSSEKRLWPLFWSNSCCSHPRLGETMDMAVERRLRQELGMNSEPEFLYTFEYRASYEDLGSEHEMCRVYAGLSDDEPRPHPCEIADHRWIDPARLNDELRSDPTSFTPWLQLEWPRVRETYRSVLGL